MAAIITAKTALVNKNLANATPKPRRTRSCCAAATWPAGAHFGRARTDPPERGARWVEADGRFRAARAVSGQSSFCSQPRWLSNNKPERCQLRFLDFLCLLAMAAMVAKHHGPPDSTEPFDQVPLRMRRLL